MCSRVHFGTWVLALLQGAAAVHARVHMWRHVYGRVRFGSLVLVALRAAATAYAWMLVPLLGAGRRLLLSGVYVGCLSRAYQGLLLTIPTLGTVHPFWPLAFRSSMLRASKRWSLKSASPPSCDEGWRLG